MQDDAQPGRQAGSRLPALKVAGALLLAVTVWLILTTLLHNFLLTGGSPPAAPLRLAFDALSLIAGAGLLFGAIRLGGLRLNAAAPGDHQYRDMFEGSAAANLLIDPKTGCIVDANPAACAFYGYPRDVLLTMHVTDFNQLSEGEVFSELSSAATGQKRHFSFRHRLHSGEVRDVEVTVSPIQTGGRSLLHSIVEDVTERLQAERMTQAEHARLSTQTADQARFKETLLDTLPVGVLAIYAQGQIVDLNLAMERISGYTRDDLLGEPVSMLVVPEEQESIMRRLGAAMRQLALAPFEIDGVRKDGTVVPVRVRMTALHNSSGEPMGIIATVEDLTRSRQAESALRESRLMMQTVLDTMPQAVFWKDTNSVYMGCNRAFAVDAGLSTPEEIVGLADSDLPWTQEESESYSKADRRIVETGIGQYGALDILPTFDGKIAWIRVTKVPLRDETGAIAGVLGIYQDVTDRKEAEEKLRYQADLLQSVSDAIISADTHFIVQSWNNAAEKLYGWTADEAIGKPMYELFGPVYAEPGQDRSTAAGGDTWESEMAQTRSDGQTIYVQSTVSLIRDAAGNPSGTVAVLRDISARRAIAESEREQRALAVALHEVATAIGSTLEQDEVLDRILLNIEGVVPHEVAMILLCEGGTAHIARFRGDVPASAREELAALTLDLERITNLRQMIATRQPLVVDDLREFPDWVRSGAEEWERSYVGAPIVVEGEVIGFINLTSRKPGFFKPVHAERLQAFADQAAIALKNARLYQSEREQLHLSRTLQEVGTLLTAQMSLDEVFERIFDLLAGAVPFVSVSVQLVDDRGGLALVAGRGHPDPDAARRITAGIPPQVIADRWADHDVVVLSDTATDPRWVPHPDQAYIRSRISAALRVQGRLVGVLNVDHSEPNTYDEGMGRTVAAFAGQAAIAIENARLFRESQDRNRRLEALNRITRVGTEMHDLDEGLHQLADLAADMLDAGRCYITLWDAETRTTIPAAASGDYHAVYRRGPSRPGETTVTSAVLDVGRPFVVPEGIDSLLLAPDARERFASEGDFAPRSVLALPLQADGRDIGALLVAFGEPHPFSDGEIAWAGQSAELIALAVAKGQAYAELEQRVAARTADLESANRRLVQLTHLKDEFVSNVSHELRTPITSIKLYHHLLDVRPDKQDMYLDRLNRETDRLEMLIEDLLYLSRMDQGQLRLTLSLLDVAALAEQVVIDREPLAAQQGLSLTFQRNSPPPPVQGDTVAVGRVVSVLLTNALSYTPAGGTVRVSVGSGRRDGRLWATLAVADSGPGIPPEEIPRLFERFFRGAVGYELGVPGTGLGLPIAHEIVQHHGGTIEVDSGRPGEGARFTVWLPAADGDSSEGMET